MSSSRPKLTVKLKERVAPPPSGSPAWGMLLQFMEKVHSSGGSRIVEAAAASFSFEELYGAVSDACLQQRGGELYSELRSRCTVRSRAAVAALDASPDDARLLLESVARTWRDYCAQMGLLRAVFSYLDRSYVPGSGGSAIPLDALGPLLFGSALAEAPATMGRMTSAMITVVRAERDGELLDRTAAVTVVRMLSSLGAAERVGGRYVAVLEPALVAASDHYFEAEGTREISVREPSAYLQYAEGVLRQEQDRCSAFLLPSTWKLLRPIVLRRLLAQHAAVLLERGFAPLASAGRASDLALMYRLLLLVGKTDDLRKYYSDFCKAAAVNVVGVAGDEERDKVLVLSLLDLRDTQDKLVAGAFQGNDAFVAALRGAIEIAINSRENKPAELVAKFVDAQLRSGGKAVGGDVALDGVLDKVLAIFRVIHGKDVFEAFYKKDLAKRLLLGRSASMDTEKAMVARLKAECGSGFTSKLEGMFKDTELSSELMAQYEVAAGLPGAPPRGIDMFAHVLTASYWPSYTADAASVRLPPSAAAAKAAFEQFYASKYTSNRQLKWVHSLGHCLVKAAFPTGRKELDVSLHQAIVLHVFNRTSSAVYTEIRDATGLPDAELRTTLQSLALGQVRVLRKEPKGREVLDEDVFRFNDAFTHPMMRIKINQIQMKETKAEADATNERVMADRQYQIDAAVVRIMKSRKALSHQGLLAELFAQLRFPCKASDIKPRIESLIERDYLERDGAEPPGYTYLA